jgi:hypothetical protein
VTVLDGAALRGDGIVAGPTTMGHGSTLAPGSSPGELAFSNGLALQNGSHFEWELAALDTASPTNWDRLTLTGGQLSIAAGAVLDLEFIGSATAPSAVPFWAVSHRWNNIIDLTGSATNPTGFVDFQINNSPWAQFGAFDTLPAQLGRGVDLVWTPVPEPASWALFLAGAGLLWCMRRTARHH